MKQQMKKLWAAVLAVAMVLSLTVTAGATSPITSPLTSTGTTQGGDINQAVTNQGAKPADVVNVTMPTATVNAFEMIFDAHDLIQDTVEGHGRYDSLNSGDGVVFEEGTKLYFKNTTKTPQPIKDVLVGPNDSAIAGTKVVKWTKGTVTKIYLKLKADNTFDNWVDDNGAALTYSSTKYTVLENYIKGTGDTAINPLVDTGLFADNVEDLNKNKFVDFKKTDAVGAASTNVAGMDEYSFIAYSTASGNTVYLDEAGNKVYASLGTSTDDAAAASVTPGADVSATKNALGTAGYYEMQQNNGVVSYASTSDKVKVINKGNKPIGVSMTATLSGVPDTTYTYAASYQPAVEADEANGIEASDAKFLDAEDKEIKSGAILYIGLTDGTDMEAMTYANSKGSVTFESSVDGSPDKYDLEWQGTVSSGLYLYQQQRQWQTKDFPFIEFNLFGAINENTDWDTLNGAALNVTWTVKAYSLIAPTLKADALTTSKAWTVKVEDNKSAAVLDSLKWFSTQTDTGTAFEVTETLDEETGGTVSFNVAKNTFSTKPAKIEVTFKDQNDETVTTTVTYVPT